MSYGIDWRIIMNDEVGRMWKEVIVAYFNAMPVIAWRD
jgi:hypothetical protein